MSELFYTVEVVTKKDFYYKLGCIEPTKVIREGESTYIDFKSGNLINC